MTRPAYEFICSSFIMSSTIKYHSSKYKNSDKLTFDRLNLSHFINDLFSGKDNVMETFKLPTKAVDILKEGEMNLRNSM